MNNNYDSIVRAEIVSGVSQKNGKPFKAIQFFVNTSQGEYQSPLCFPTPLEISLIEKSINKFNSIFSDEEN